MKHALQFLCIALVFTCAACAPVPPELFANGGTGFADAQLVASKIEVITDGAIVVTAMARVEKGDAGFRIVVPANWELWKPLGFPTSLYRGTIRIESIGQPTQAFVQAVATAYDQKINRYEFTSVTLTAISLQGDPGLVRTVPVKLKIFYESQKDDEYAEGFLNLDLAHKTVQFSEKDPSYRKAIVGYLTRKMANQMSEPTITSVTPAAAAPVAPVGLAAHY